MSEGAFTNAEVCELAAKVLKETNGDAAKAAEAVILRALDRNSKDNISCMIVLFGGPPAGSGGAMGRHRESSTSFSAGNAPAAFTLGKQRELQPGSLVGSENASFVKAYVVMCERGGMSFAEATEKRYDLLLKRKGTPAAREEDETELELIGKPEGAEGSAQRKGWFEEWAKRCQERSDEDGDGAGVGSGPMDQLAMMRMLMQVMQPAGVGPGGGIHGRGSAAGRGRGRGRGGR